MLSSPFSNEDLSRAKMLSFRLLIVWAKRLGTGTVYSTARHLLLIEQCKYD